MARQAGAAWLEELAACPDVLEEGAAGGSQPHCGNGLWSDARYDRTHPGASYCMRSLKKTPGGAGQQVSGGSDVSSGFISTGPEASVCVRLTLSLYIFWVPTSHGKIFP